MQSFRVPGAGTEPTLMRFYDRKKPQILRPRWGKRGKPHSLLDTGELEYKVFIPYDLLMKPSEVGEKYLERKQAQESAIRTTHPTDKTNKR